MQNTSTQLMFHNIKNVTHLYRRVMGTEEVTAMHERLPGNHQRPSQAWFVQECKRNKAVLPRQFICPSPGRGKNAWGILTADSSKHTCLSPGALAVLFHQLRQPSNFSVLILKISKAIFPQIDTWQKSAFPGSRALFDRMNFLSLLTCLYINIHFTNEFKTPIVYSVELPLNQTLKTIFSLELNLTNQCSVVR